MLHGEQRELFDLSFSLPSECADRLREATAEIGIVPSIELTRQTLEIIPGAGIACRGPVRSILLISKVPFTQIRTLAADSSSRTSVALSRIILDRKYAVQPLLRSEKPDLVRMLDHADACLIIGDPALLLDPSDIPFHVLDLGAEWADLTGLPMVFAVWAARPEALPKSPEPFMASLQFGLNHLDDIVRTEHVSRQITADLAHEYLTRNIVFQLGEAEYRGLDRFLQYSQELSNLSARAHDKVTVL
jgi:predicted solute-binding protein